MYAHKLTSSPLPTPQRAAKNPCTSASFAASGLMECARATRPHLAPRRLPVTKSKHAAIRPRAFGTNKPDDDRANVTAVLQSSSGRSSVLYASQRDTHGGAGQVQYSQPCSTFDGFRLKTLCCCLQVVAVTCGAMVLAAIHRVTFSVLAVPFAVSFSFFAHN